MPRGSSFRQIARYYSGATQTVFGIESREDTLLKEEVDDEQTRPDFLALPILLAGIGAADFEEFQDQSGAPRAEGMPHEHRLVQRLFEEDS